jgi:hypothetical protein
MVKMYDPKTGDYVGSGHPLDRMDDSVLSGIGTAPVVRKALGFDAENVRTALHPTKRLTTEHVVRDLEGMVQGRRDWRAKTEFIRTCLREAGYDPDADIVLPPKQRKMLHDKCVQALRLAASSRASNLDSVVEMLLTGRDEEIVLWEDVTPGNKIGSTVASVRRALGMSVEDFVALPREKKMLHMRRASRRLHDEAVVAEREEEMREHRSALYEWLQTWGRGPLVLERPTASSLHHLIEYDLDNTPGKFGRTILEADSMQIVLVEHDWGAAVPPMRDAPWRVPFPLMCWEFRISGVRVLAFTDGEDDASAPNLFLVYGRDGHWVIDDVVYSVSGSGELRSHGSAATPKGELPRSIYPVVRKAHACIRATCIMMEAEVARQEVVATSQKIKERRKCEGKAPLRDHYVVKLVNLERRAYANRPRTAGRLTDARAPQRGHWRKATWVHYDDPDSGQEQYANDGGFVVSRTWRKWHFAGDPNNIIHKEYRV